MYIAGIDPTRVWASTEVPEFGLGDIGANKTTEGVKWYMFVQADSGGVTGDGYVAIVDSSSNQAVMVTTTNSAPGVGAGKVLGCARAVIPANSFFWLQVGGRGSIRVAASCAAYTILNTTATAGQLDDDATVGSEVVDGAVLDVANGGSAGLVAGYLNWPKVGRTL